MWLSLRKVVCLKESRFLLLNNEVEFMLNLMKDRF